MLSKLKKLKLNKIAIISISILISLALCFGFFYAALINQEKQKMEVSVLEISPYTEELSIAGKEITQNYAVTTINGKKYINNLNTVKLLLKGTDENYSGNSLTASNIVVKVGGSVVTPKTKTLGSAQNITNGVQYELTLAGIPGNGVLTVEVDANTLTDKSQNKNILTKFDSKIEVDNTAPTIAASDITYGDTLQITLSDSSSLVNKWAITSSNVLPTTGWNEITQTQKQTVTKTGLTVGTYYIWAKDSVENVSSKSIKVTGKSIDNSSISVALNPTTYTYDGTEKKPGVTVKDGTNTLTVGTDYSFVYSNNINAGTGKVTITGKGNYTGTKVVNFTINKRTLTVKAEAKSKTYGAGDPGLTYTYSNQVSGQTPKFSGALSRAEGENVGTYAINKNTLVLVDNSPFLANNYKLSYVGANLTITAKNASTFTATLNPTSYTYDGTEKKPSVTVKDGENLLAVGTDYSFVYSDNINAGTGKVTITGKGNYTGTKVLNFTINKRAITVKAEAKSKTYGAGDPGLTYTYSNQVSGQTPKFSGTLSRDEGENVGTYAIKQNTLALADNSPFLASNYTLAYTGANLTINKANAVNPSLKSYTGTYDGEAHKIEVTGGSGGTIQYSTDNATWQTSNPGRSGQGEMIVYVRVLGDANHNTTESISAKVTISKREITIKAADGTKTYDGADLTNSTATLTSGTLVSGQSLTATATGSITNVGSTANIVSSVVINNASGANVTGNYTITKANGTLTINKRTLTVKADAKSKTYGAGDPGLTYTYSNQVSGQTPKFSGALSRDAGENVGTYAIKQNTLALADNSPFLANNYTIAYMGANLTINAKNASTFTVTLSPTSYTYDGGAKTPTATVKDGNTTLTLNTHYTVTYSNNINAGTATATITGKGNYTGTKAVNFTINKRTLTVKADAKSKTYGAGDPGLTYTYSNQVSGQTPKFSGALSRDGGENVGTYAIKQNTLVLADNSPFLANNYTISYTGANLTINAKNASTFTVTLSPTSYTYDGGAKTPTATVKDGNTTLTLNTHYTVTYSNNINAGTATATITGKGNYTGTKAVNFTINKRTLTVKAEAKSKTYGAGDPGLTYTYSNQVSGQTPKFSGALSRDAGENVGTYAIKQNTLALADNSPFLANNYTLAYTGANLTINRAATATAAAANKTYNGSSQTGVTGSYVSWGGTTAGIDAGSYTATATPDGNHAWSDGTTAAKSITWTMSARGVAVTWGTTTTFTYNGAAQGPTASAASGVTGETINVTRTTETNAGSYTSTASISSVTGGRAKAGNYTLTGTTKAFTINKANLTLTFSANSGSVSYKKGTGSFTVTPSGYIGSETGTLNVASGNSNYISVTSGNESTAKNNTAVTVGYQVLQYTSSKINITVSIAETTNYNSISKTYEVTITDTEAPILTISSNKTYAKSHAVTVVLADGGSGLASGTYNITCIEAPEDSQTPTTTSRTITVSSAGTKSATTTFTVSGTTGICKVTAYLSTEVKDVAGNSLAAGTSVTGEQYLDNTAPELSDFKYAISTSKPTSYSSASYNVKFDITEGHSGMAGYYDTVDLSTSLSSTDSRWKAHTGKTIIIEGMKYGTTEKIWLKDNAGNVSYKTFSLSAVAVSTETNCYVLYPTLQSAIGTGSSNSTLRKWNSFWNSYIIKKC